MAHKDAYASSVLAALHAAGGELSFVKLNDVKHRPPGKLSSVLLGIKGVAVSKRSGVNFASIVRAPAVAAPRQHSASSPALQPPTSVLSSAGM